MIQRTNTYQATWPKSSHWRKATCEEVDCPHFLMGWVTKVLIGSDMDDYIREVSKSRKYKVVREGELNAYYFDAGQQCFGGEAGTHHKKLERGAWLTKNAATRNPKFLEQVAMESERWIDEFNEEAHRSNIRR